METILHPVRFKIIQRFLDGQSKTAKILAKELKEIPQATLYRQLDTLVKADVLIIIDEHQIRGTVEKVYSLNLSAVNIANKQLKKLTKEEHLQYFMLFTAQLSKDFEAYLQNKDIDYEKDGVGYRQVALNLTDEEFLEFAKDLGKVYEKYVKNTPSAERTRRIISTIIIPEKGRGTGNE
jgi:hypothetical protein